MQGQQQPRGTGQVTGMTGQPPTETPPVRTGLVDAVSAVIGEGMYAGEEPEGLDHTVDAVLEQEGDLLPPAPSQPQPQPQPQPPAIPAGAPPCGECGGTIQNGACIKCGTSANVCCSG